jgi:hypothetical protein
MSSELASAESNIENPEQLVGQLREQLAKAKQEAAYFKKLYNEVLEKCRVGGGRDRPPPLTDPDVRN